VGRRGHPTTTDAARRTVRNIKTSLGTAPKQLPAATAGIVERVLRHIPTSSLNFGTVR